MDKEIKTAVDWWKRQLSHVPSHNAGDEDLNMWLLMIEAGKPNNQQTNIDKFGEILTARLQAAVKRQKTFHPEDNPYLSLHTDYSAEDDLEIAAMEANVHGFPVKTIMSIVPGKVTVAKGYGASRVTLYPTTIN